jgi:FKBP-type peptidyl-prolyl cis-trans isomerase SlyD
MQIGRDKVVALSYTLRNEQGKILEESGADNDLYYLHGHSNLVPGLEEALAGLRKGDTFDVVVPPEKGFGSRNESLLLELPQQELPEGVTPMKGRRLELRLRDQVRQATIVKVKLKSVVVDANHEYADQTLRYSGTILDVRQATKVELSHCHAHAPGHHH